MVKAGSGVVALALFLVAVTLMVAATRGTYLAFLRTLTQPAPSVSKAGAA